MKQREHLVRRFALNTAGRDLIVGDVHGHFSRLWGELVAIGFDGARDRLFCVGDLVDRGPESPMVLEWLNQPWFHSVTGNHEDMAIRYPRGNMDVSNYIRNGGHWNVGLPWSESARIADALSALPVAIEIETRLGPVGVVHANVPGRLTWPEFCEALVSPDLSNNRHSAIVDTAMWDRGRADRIGAYGAPPGVDDVRAVVVGHTPVADPAWVGNVLHIDTGGWFPKVGGGRFTIIDAATLAPVEQQARG